jgi:hypothetical protein
LPAPCYVLLPDTGRAVGRGQRNRGAFMRITNNLRRRAVTWATAGLAVTAVAGALSLTAASAAR